MTHPEHPLAEHSSQPEIREGHLEVPGGNVWYGIVGANSPGVPLLTLHGGPGYTHDDLVTLRQLAGDRPVIFYDQLGVGKSDRPDDPSLWTLDRAVAELEAVREALKLDKVHLFGFSWGGTVVAEYLLQKNPSGVESAVLAGPYLSASLTNASVEKCYAQIRPDAFETIGRYESIGDTNNPEYKELKKQFDERFVLGKPEDKFDEYIQDALKRSEEGFNEQILTTVVGKSVVNRTGNLKEHERVEDLGRIHVPTLYISGRDDQEGIDNIKLYHERTPGSEFVIIENSAHMPHLTHPDEYNRIVSGFLQRVERRGKE